MKRNNILKLFMLVMMSTGCALQTSESSKNSSSKKESSSLPIQLLSTTSTSSNDNSMQSSTPLDTSYEEQSTIISSTSSEESSSVNEIVSNHYKGNYYDGFDFTLVDSAMKAELRELITTTHTYTISYGELRYSSAINGTKNGRKIEGLPTSDASLTDPSKVVCIYSREEVSGTWDGGNTWNREHVWPQGNKNNNWSWFPDTGNSTRNAGSDLHHLRPETPGVNSSRGNKAFANSTTNDTYEPVDEAKGDVARILLYMFTRYSEADAYPVTHVASSWEMLLEWNKLDPVDAWEMQRNDVGEGTQGNRNPFIDYPELADFIWG